MIYRGIGPEKGHIIPEEQAYEYALSEIDKDPELRAELVEWFYSGNFIKEDENEQHYYGETCVGLQD